MSQPTFFLSWESHKSNICNGLSALQQNEEFVDMTLAADGHHVKVHQMVMALASPYIKELISSTDCRHPVIFLHKTSYTTLSAILEYIYTGEVVIAIDNLTDLVEAAKELHIKGLEDMKFQESLKGSNALKLKQPQKEETEDEDENTMDDEIHYFEVTDEAEKPDVSAANYTLMDDGTNEESTSVTEHVEETYEEVPTIEMEETLPAKKPRMEITLSSRNPSAERPENLPTVIQYTVSNQGSLQMILNRFMYYLKHCNRNSSRQWRCVDYLNQRKCPALVITKDDVIVQRISAHNHPFHDKRILKKVEAGAVFTQIQEAEIQGTYIKSKPNVKQDQTEKEDSEQHYVLSN